MKFTKKIILFFYEQSNYKVGASENNLQIEIDENREELFNNYYFKNNSEKYYSEEIYQLIHIVNHFPELRDKR